MEVRHDEGIAIHIGPEPCVVGREARDEASVGEGTGQPLSRDRNILGADAVEIAEGNMVEHAECSGNPAWSENLACVDASCTGTGSSRVRPAAMPFRSASGRRGAVADDARAREVRTPL